MNDETTSDYFKLLLFMAECVILVMVLTTPPRPTLPRGDVPITYENPIEKEAREQIEQEHEGKG